jgi:hypothetical protein
MLCARLRANDCSGWTPSTRLILIWLPFSRIGPQTGICYGGPNFCLKVSHAKNLGAECRLARLRQPTFRVRSPWSKPRSASTTRGNSRSFWPSRSASNSSGSSSSPKPQGSACASRGGRRKRKHWTSVELDAKLDEACKLFTAWKADKDGAKARRN